ncbi:hypothetical protein K438DRAFT_1992208 [Mycena galopus ATCC 62051]|nr:hypothetical protein K438DRAFT_1992208 [Mycena galopus ATCC 62051]
MASVSPAEELELLQLIADAQTTNYLAAAGIALLVFEHISTFSEEVEFVWKSVLSLWSVLYVWVYRDPARIAPHSSMNTHRSAISL